ncbi:MAG: TIR domain-containing protein [Pirellulales bacterium]|nr:TIR domain-containing protein [Pirellulales bacterium]
MTKVFISYAHSSPKHKQIIADLVTALRENDLIVTVDTDVKTPQGPEEGWPGWMKRQIKDADWVLMFFDELYRRRFDGEEEPNKGLGVTWEGAIIACNIYRSSAKNKKYLPLLADGASTDLIPAEFFGYTRYCIPKQTVKLATALRQPPATPAQKIKGESLRSSSLEPILQEFRDAYAECGNAAIFVAAIPCVDGKATLPKLPTDSAGRYFGTLCVLGGVTLKNAEGPPITYSYSLFGAGGEIEQVMKIWQGLARRAGALLPMSETNHMGVVNEDSPESLWTTFLLHRTATLGFVREQEGCRILENLFAASIRAIEVSDD